MEENNLNQAVSALRQALGGGAKDRRFIVTPPGKGYRFVANVAEVNKEAEPAVEGSTQRPCKLFLLTQCYVETFHRLI